VVDSDLVLVAQLAKELAIVGDDVVQVARNLDSLALLTLDKLENVLLGLLDLIGLTGNLDLATSSTSSSLLGDVELDIKLRLERTAGFTTTTNEEAVLIRRNLDSLGGLVLKRRRLSLEGSNDLLNNALGAFDTNGSLIRLSARESYHARKVTSIVGPSSGSDNGADVRSTTTDEVPVVLPVDLKGLNSGVVENLGTLLQDLLSLLDLLLGTFKLDFSTARRIRALTSTGYVDLAARLETELLHLATTRTDKLRNLALSELSVMY
jgi:hypothetical protein